MSISLAAKCSGTAGLNINPIPQVIHGENFVRGSGLVPESLPLAMFRMNESGILNHREDLKPLPMTPSQNLQTGAQPPFSSHLSRSTHEDKEVVKSLTSGLLPREPTGAQEPILPLLKPYAKKVYKGNLQNHSSITSKSAKRGKRHTGAPQYPNNYKAYGEGKGEKMTKAESRTNQNTSNSRKGGKKIDRANGQHHQTSKSISVGRKEDSTFGYQIC